MTTEKIKNALITYGVKGKVTLRKVGIACIEVKVNGKIYGIWEISKATFVA